MRRLAALLAALPGLALLGLVSAAGGAQQDEARLMLSLDSPEPGALVGDPGGMAFISGKALALFGEFQTFDIVFVIDTSESTSTASGADIDGDGKVGRPVGGTLGQIFARMIPLPNTDRGDSILAAEVAAIQVLLEQLDPRTTRVGLVSFAGDHDPMTPDAFTIVPLTTDYDKVQRGLDDVLDLGSAGLTNMVSGVNRGIVELIGTHSAYSDPRPNARRIMLFLTDGVPTLPLEGQRANNAKMAIQRAVKATKASIRIDTYAIGEEAVHEPVVAVEMARVTSGVFTPVRDPRNLRAIFEEVSFAQIETLEVRNLTTRESAAYAIRNADGSFSALVPMRPGKNTVEVFARATDGTEARRKLPLRFLADAAVQDLSPRQLAQRNRLLENRLLDLQRRRLEIETERDEQVRRELRVEIEKERAAAERRADEARRRLRIDVEN
jgi:hypothetical protein